MQNLFFFGHKKALAEKCKVRKELMPRNSGHCGGRGWIRTIEAEKQQIYSLPPLATRELVHIGSALIRCRYPVLLSEKMELVDGLEPPTC